MPSACPKILFYSHDTFGLGNIRRTLLLAEAIGEEYTRASQLIVTGSPMIHAFRIPVRTDYIKLPCLTRTEADRYDPSYLNSQQAEVSDIRRGVLDRAIAGFAPDLIIIDKRAAGIGGELLDPLRALRRQRIPAKVVLGIRDILDAPQPTRLSLKRARDMDTIARYYDEVWIYGERSIFDAIAEYGFPPEVARKTHYCGYLKRPTRPRVSHVGAPRILVTTGGGADGTELIETYLEGLMALPRSIALSTTVVFGPQMPRTAREVLLQRFGRLTDVSFVDFEPDLSSRYAAADLVISMAGYNTVCELLSWALPAVLVPRHEPVGEQLLRARLLAARGLFHLIEPGGLRPDRLLATVLSALQAPPAPTPLDLDGLPRIRQRVRALLTEHEP
jgi:predicted glycosyltransferase